VEKSCVAKAEKGKKVKDNCCIIATEYAFPKNMNWNASKFAMFTKFYKFTTVETCFFVPEPL